MLHWANKDQYYIKSGENFSNYTIKLDDGRKVHFRLVAADTAKDNRKDNDKDRRFALVEAKTIVRTDEEGEEYEESITPIEECEVIESGETTTELVIRFEYIAVDKKTKQDALNAEAIKRIFDDATVKAHWLDLSSRKPTEKNPQRTLLEKNLTDYTSKNSADYFIHKDLEGFLRNELDFYIKNEVMHLDDVQEAERFADIEKNLRMIQCFRAIGRELIRFLAQIENFQKKLWLKKKFVVETNYCITLDRVPEELYPEIAANDAQREEWVKLFAIDEIKAEELGQVDYSVPLSVEFLKANTYLTLDTSYFALRIQHQLINRVSQLEEQCSGTLIHSENFQGLNLVASRYRRSIQCMYIDPPFNLGQNADFLYKTDYKDSSWTTLLSDRVKIARTLLKNEGIFYLRCDDNGNYLARPLLETIFGENGYQYEINVQRIRKNVTKQGKISLPLANDSLFLCFNSENAELIDPYLKLKETREAYWRRIDDSAGFRNPPIRTIFGKTFTPYKYDAHFKYSQKSIDEMTKSGRISLQCKTKKCKYRHTEGIYTSCPECGNDNATPKYLVAATDVKILDTNWMDIAGYSSRTGFSTENAEALLERAINVGSKESDVVADFFAGSGTTLAVAQKNNRRWIGVEIGEQINQYIIPRLKKISQEFPEGSLFFKYLRLESYEDTLNNLQLQRDVSKELFTDELEDDYLLNYMLDVESQGSLLSVEDFKKPFDYTLKIAADSAGAFTTQKVDMVETFNYLIGLRVKHIDAQFERGYVTVEGTLPSEERCLVLWRDCEQVDYDALNTLCEKLQINPKDSEYDVVYINGDHNIPSITQEAEDEGGISRSLKLRQIEPEFLQRMFEVEDV